MIDDDDRYIDALIKNKQEITVNSNLVVENLKPVGDFQGCWLMENVPEKTR